MDKSVCARKYCGMLSYVMVCGAGGFPMERNHYSYYHTIWFLFCSLPRANLARTRVGICCAMYALVVSRAVRV